MNLPLPDIKDGQHLILNGSDKSHFITPVKQVCLNPPGGLVTVFTRLWLDATSPSRELKKTAFCGLVTVTRHSDTRHQPVQSLPRTPEGHHTQLLHGAAGGPDPPQCHRLPKGRVCKLCFPANFRRWNPERSSHSIPMFCTQQLWDVHFTPRPSVTSYLVHTK